MKTYVFITWMGNFAVEEEDLSKAMELAKFLFYNDLFEESFQTFIMNGSSWIQREREFKSLSPKEIK
jgi:hypothetical protein